jgi:hypothetical protein
MTVADSWIIYAILAVLVFLILLQIATQWNVKSAEAENLRASVLILGVIAAAMVVWYFIK